MKLNLVVNWGWGGVGSTLWGVSCHTGQSHLIQSIYSQLINLTCNLKLCLHPYWLCSGISQACEKTPFHSARGQTRLLRPLSALDNTKAVRTEPRSLPTCWTVAVLQGSSSVRLPLITLLSKDVLNCTRQSQTWSLQNCMAGSMTAIRNYAHWSHG